MNCWGRTRFSLISYLLIAAVIGTVAFYLQNRTFEIASSRERMDLLQRLRQLDIQLDRDVLRVSSLQMYQYDTLVDLAHEVRLVGGRIADPSGVFVGQTNKEVETALRRSIECIERKLAGLERIKSEAALLRNGLQYLPIAVAEYSGRDPRMGGQLAYLLNRLYSAQLFPSESDISWIGQSLAQTGKGGPVSDELFQSIIFHMQGHLKVVATLGALRAAYEAEPSSKELALLHGAYERWHGERAERANWVSLALMGVTVLLLVLLGFTLRRLHSALLQAEQAGRKLHDAVDSLSEAFSLFGPDGTLLLYNERFLAFYPWLAGNIGRGKSLCDLNAIARKAGELLPVRDALTRVDSVACSYVQQTADGRWFLASDSRTADGGLVCVRTDITESKKRELQLRQLMRALEQSPISVIITDTTGVIEYVNPKFAEVTGYSVAEAIGNNPRILKSGEKRPHEYRELWETITDGREWRGVFLNRRKDGELVWESASISPLRDDQGRITHFVAVKEDITQRKQAEDTLRLHATVFETTAEGIIVTDADNRIRTVNPAFSRITGYLPEEVIGHDPGILSSGRHGPGFYQAMWNSVNATGQWSGEIWNRRKDGEIYPEWLSIVSILDEKGKAREYIAVFSDITRRKLDEEKILRQANYDDLTGLPNRTLLFDRLAQAMCVADRTGGQVALLFIDLDRFKGVNDVLGHATGDEMLRMVSERLRKCVRLSDTVARFGGDEFVIVLERIPSVAAVAGLAEKVIKVVSEPFHLSGRELFIGASIGVSLFPSDARDAETLVRSADVAMYQAKEAGRNRFQFFTAEMNRRTEARMEMERGLRRALEREQLRLEYQPIYSLHTGELVRVEALLRWQHPELGSVRPEHFIPLAEESGLIAPIGLWVLRTACAQVKEWRRHPGMAHLGLAVNLSSRQWRLGLDVATIGTVLSECGLRPQALTLEITEGMVLEGTEDVVAWLGQLRALGVELAIDDFGTGYSSLSYLKRFPVSELKIDYSFVRDLPGDEGSGSLVRAILSMARSLGLGVVAEGVENYEQLTFLRQAGCDLVQGFFLGKPQPPEQVPELARQSGLGEWGGARAADLFS